MTNGLSGNGPSAHPTMFDIAWAAGIFEGEGSAFSTVGRDRLGRGQTQRLVIYQKDSWLPQKLMALFGGSIQHMKNRNCGFGKSRSLYQWVLTGPRARGFMMTIFSFLSPRRQGQIREALNAS